MRYIPYWKCDAADYEVAIAKNKKVREAINAHPKKYTKNVLAARTTGLGDLIQGFTVTDADIAEQLVDWAHMYWPELTSQFVPWFPAELTKDW